MSMPREPQKFPEAADSAALLHYLVERGPEEGLRECASLEAWWHMFRERRRMWLIPIDEAVVGGMLADRVAYAFAAGYQAAIRCLVPSLPQDCRVSLSVTEEGGGHPRAVKATLRLACGGGDPAGETWLLSGHKKWATLSVDGDIVLVAASTGVGADGRNRLRIVQIALDSPGVTVTPMPAPPFAPEITHGEIHFHDVQVASDNILPGDGYGLYVKPFRTVEDIHVAAGILGHILAVAMRFNWPSAVQEDLLWHVAGLRSLGVADFNAPETHIALAGFFTSYRRVLDAIESHWDSVTPDIRARWRRDAGLLNVAGTARAKRGEAAWRVLHGSEAGGGR